MIILMGLAGSGKSTQGQKLAEAMGRVWLSTGRMIRESGKYDEVINTGALIDDAEMTTMLLDVVRTIEDAGQKIILDGYPRNTVQAEFLGRNLAEKLEKVIIIDVPKEELVKRLMLRGREDDTEEAIRERFEILERNLAGMCEILMGYGVKVQKIDGTGSPEEVFQRVYDLVKGENAPEKGENVPEKGENE